MNPTHIIQLGGCSPIPLAHYLKALGILRLVAEQTDPGAAGCWNRDRFDLHTELDCDGLIEFFLKKYRPTPILAPWNGGSGFYFQEEKLKQKDPVTGKRLKTGKRNQPTEATRVVEFLGATNDVRFRAYRNTIDLTRKLLSQSTLEAAPDGAAKDDLLVELRNRWPDAAIEWLDCVLVLTRDTHRARSRTGLFPNYTALLGSGANDGNADFSSNFMQRLEELLLNPQNQTGGHSRQWLVASLFGTNVPRSRIKALAGQYSPGTAGGPNALSGFKGEFSINPWDFVLLMEGALFFAAAAVRRHGVGGNSGMAYPFAVRTAGVGYASANATDELVDKSSTEELWLPLWSSPTRRDELLAVLSEGRAQVGKSAARTGVDFARAVCANGTDRGFSEFVRYGFLIRRGDSSSATPLGRFTVRRNARVDLLSETDRWLEDLRSASGPSAKKVPASVLRAMNHLETQILGLCQQNDAARLQAVLIALGRCERTLACSQRWAKGEDIKPPQIRVRPLAGLSSRWLLDGNTGSVEFRLAAAVASLGGRYGKTAEAWLPLRSHLEPVESPRAGWFRWAENATSDVQWTHAPLPSILNAIFSRRLLRAEQAGTNGLPDSARIYARLPDIAAFIEGETDDDLLADLIWGLSLLDWSNVARAESPGGRGPDVAPSLYALLKLCFWPNAPSDEAVPLVPAIHRRAAAGDGVAASELASRRVRSSGLRPAVTGLPLRGTIVQRTAAALLFPLHPSQRAALGYAVLRPAEIPPRSTAAYGSTPY